MSRLLGYRLGGNVVVRCRQGHVYATAWIPGVKLKGVDLVVAVRDADLTEGERQFARAHHDLPIP